MKNTKKLLVGVLSVSALIGTGVAAWSIGGGVAKSTQELSTVTEEIIGNRDITLNVTKDPTDYTNSRNNGESLVHDYVVPDIIENTTADAVIISHSHIEGYGEGFYVATPAMDDASVYLGESIRDSGIDFNYFPSNSNGNYQSSSAALVSAPLANAGFPTLVYEIPENITSWDSTSRTYDLLQVVYDLVS